ncbi:MAG: hypothetical protein AAFY60_10730 [Myxococcota bacterium]
MELYAIRALCAHTSVALVLLAVIHIHRAGGASTINGVRFDVPFMFRTETASHELWLDPSKMPKFINARTLELVTLDGRTHRVDVLNMTLESRPQ